MRGPLYMATTTKDWPGLCIPPKGSEDNCAHPGSTTVNRVHNIEFNIHGCKAIYEI